MLALYLVDVMLLDLSGVYQFQVRQIAVCTGLLSDHNSTRDVSLGRLINVRAYILGGGKEMVLLAVCSTCDCPLGVGSLLVNNRTVHLISVWQSGETGYWGHWKPFDVYVFRFDGVFDPSPDIRVRSSSGDNVPIDSRPLLEWFTLSAGSGALSTHSHITQTDFPEVVVCTQYFYDTRRTALGREWMRAWADHMAGLGANVIRVYVPFGLKAGNKSFPWVIWERNLTVAALREVLLGRRVSLEYVVPPWHYKSMDGKMGFAGHAWNLNECLYSSKSRGARFMAYIDMDEYLDIGTFQSLAQLGHHRDDSLDAITFPSVLYAYHGCFGNVTSPVTSPRWSMLCHAPYPDCKAMIPKGFGFEQKCLGPRGRRKFLIRVETFAHLQIHTPDASMWNTLHASERDGLQIRHYRGLMGADLKGGENASCLFRFARHECSAAACDLVHKGFVCGKDSSPSKT